MEVFSGQMILKAHVDSLADGGAFVATVISDDPIHNGKKIFVRCAVPGETIEARVTHDHKSYLEGELVSVLDESTDRVSPPCPKFGECGGCDLQHLSLAAQRSAKLKMIKGMLRSMSGITDVDPVMLGADLPGYRYRRRLTLHLDEHGKLGLYRIKTREVVSLDECFLARPLVNQGLKVLSAAAKDLAPLFAKALLEEHDNGLYLVLHLREELDPLTVPCQALIQTLAESFSNIKVVHRRRVIGESAPAARQDIAYGHFSQVNPEANQLLIDAVIAEIKASAVTELYAGAGNFSIPLARLGRRVDAVELDRELVKAGNALAEQENLHRLLRFMQGSAEKYVRSHALASELLLDPPRSGAREVVRVLEPEKVSRIVYVSCNLPTLCRDLKMLAASGYQFSHMYVLDMFPQTHHVETISVINAG